MNQNQRKPSSLSRISWENSYAYAYKYSVLLVNLTLRLLLALGVRFLPSIWPCQGTSLNQLLSVAWRSKISSAKEIKPWKDMLGFFFFLKNLLFRHLGHGGSEVAMNACFISLFQQKSWKESDLTPLSLIIKSFLVGDDKFNFQSHSTSSSLTPPPPQKRFKPVSVARKWKVKITHKQL